MSCLVCNANKNAILVETSVIGAGARRLNGFGRRMTRFLIPGIMLLVFSNCLIAEVDKTWVFCDVNPRKNEMVLYCIKPFTQDGPAWAGFIADAAKEWSDGTSWKISMTDDCSKAQVIIQQGATAGTGKTEDQKRADGKCNKTVTITVRDSPLGGDFWAKGKEEEKAKNNPLNCIKHEMGHALLLDHSLAEDSNVMWEDNTNVTALSDDDKKEGNDSQKVKLPEETDMEVLPSSKDQTWTTGDFGIDIPAETQFSPTVIGIIPFSPRSTPSFDENLPPGLDKIIRAAMYFTTKHVFPDPVDVPIIFTPVVFSPAITLSIH